MIYTGYYSKLNKYIDAGLVPISIAGKAPAFYKGIEYKKLAPTWDIFSKWKSGEIDNFEYVSRYHKEVLGKLNPKDVISAIKELSGAKDVILLCYEKSGDFCHRHVVADWLENNGIRVDEYQLE